MRLRSRLRERENVSTRHLPHICVNGLELLLIAHPGEFDLVSGDGRAFLSIFGRARGHGHDDGEESDSGRRRVRARRIYPSGSPSKESLGGYTVVDRKIRRPRCRVGTGKISVVGWRLLPRLGRSWRMMHDVIRPRADDKGIV